MRILHVNDQAFFQGGVEQILFDTANGLSRENCPQALLANGATSVTAYISHGVLSGGAVARITSSKLKELVITSTIEPTPAVQAAHNIRVISIADLIGEAINRTALEQSVSSLFD